MSDTPDRRLAAIDVGSNGFRIIIGYVGDDGKVQTLFARREPVRLGTDAFSLGRLRPETIDAAADAFAKFRGLLEKWEVSRVRAVATSAARESENADELIAVARTAGRIELEVIDGLAEAQLIFTAMAGQIDFSGRTALLIDMGGGSVEVTVAYDGRALGCETLRLGPLRLLQKLRADGLPEVEATTLIERYTGAVEALIEAELDGAVPDVCIGSGGNIERLAKLRVAMLGKGQGGKVKLGDLESLIPRLLSMSVPDRVEQLGVRSDRADLIAIAALILHMIVDEVGVNRVLVPGFGLKDGVLAQMARELLRSGLPAPAADVTT